MTALSARHLSSLEIPERSEFAARMHFLAGMLAAAIVRARLPIWVRAPHRFDADGMMFLDRLLRETAVADRSIVLEMPRRAALLAQVRAFTHLDRLDESRPSPLDPRDHATRLLALCPQGAPLDVICVAASTEPGKPESWCAEDGCDARRRVWLGPSSRRRVLASMSMEEQRAGHRAIYRAWPAEGWGYLRRAPHAWWSGDAFLIGSQAVPVYLALQNLGPHFASRHVGSLAQVADELDLGEGAAVLWTGVARLMSDTRRGLPAPAAVPWLRRALGRATSTDKRIDQIYELANHFARTRRPKALSAARRHYAEGFALLPKVRNEELRLRKRIRLLNGLALVAYHERRNDEALELQREAHLVADANAQRYPLLERWAKPLLNSNTAKLLVTRFCDPQAASVYLRHSTTSARAEVRRVAQLELAALAFDAGDAKTATQLIADALQNMAGRNEIDEAKALTLYALAALQLGNSEWVEAAATRLHHLSSVLGLEGGKAIAAALRAQLLMLRPERPSPAHSPARPATHAPA